MKPTFPVFSLDGVKGYPIWDYTKVTEDVYTYAEKRNLVDSNEIEYVVVFEKNKNWQIAQDRYSGNTYLIVLKDKDKE